MFTKRSLDEVKTETLKTCSLARADHPLRDIVTLLHPRFNKMTNISPVWVFALLDGWKIIWRKLSGVKDRLCKMLFARTGSCLKQHISKSLLVNIATIVPWFIVEIMAINNLFFGAFNKNNLFLDKGVWPWFMDFWELWQPLFSQHPVWLLAVSCQKLSPMHLEAELFLIVNKTFWDAELISTLV